MTLEVLNITPERYESLTKDGVWELIKMEGTKYIFEKVGMPPKVIDTDPVEDKIAKAEAKLANPKLTSRAKKRLQTRVQKLKSVQK